MDITADSNKLIRLLFSLLLRPCRVGPAGWDLVFVGDAVLWELIVGVGEWVRICLWIISDSAWRDGGWDGPGELVRLP